MATTTETKLTQHQHVVVSVDDGDDDERRRSVAGDRPSDEIVEKGSPASEHSADVETGDDEAKATHLAIVERDCRICHLSLDAGNHESGIPIELGCSCKNDLAAAHRHCAEAWFKIKGNKTCEICGSTAQNVSCVNESEVSEQWNESNNAAAATTVQAAETRSLWHGHRFLNFLLACMVFSFVISWLFHFNLPS